MQVSKRFALLAKVLVRIILTECKSSDNASSFVTESTQLELHASNWSLTAGESMDAGTNDDNFVM